jgi:hypothetical protein
MSIISPTVTLRLGSHSEKEYFEKLGTHFDGYIIASNLLENTPAATASLIQKFSNKEIKKIPYYIDPMTYVFGSYKDPKINRLRTDLDWIKSNQKQKESSEVIRDFKKSYKILGESFDGPFANSVENTQKTNSAILPNAFSSDSLLSDTCKKIIDYQKNRVNEVLQSSLIEEEWNFFEKNISLPAVVFAPYFYVEPEQQDEWLKLNIRFMECAANLTKDIPVHGILCFDSDALLNDNFIVNMIDEIKRSGIKGIWLWISKLNEDDATDKYLSPKLSSLKKIVEQLKDVLQVYNMHGGFFSLALSKYGMSGISHGVGYGEQKDVVPVIGQATPIVRYYLPLLYRRLGVPDIQLCFQKFGIKTPDEFHDKICNCLICKGVVKDSIDQFSNFGEMNPIKPGSTRSNQTPKAAKLCRFHFLLNRIKERDKFKNENLSIEQLLVSIDEAKEQWRQFTHINKYHAHLPVWKSILGSKKN